MIDGPVRPMNGDKMAKGEVDSWNDWTSKYRNSTGLQRQEQRENL